MNRSPGIVQYWAGCPQTPNSKWQRFLHCLKACSQRGWRTYLVWSHMPEDVSLSRPFRDAGCEIVLQPRPRGNFDGGCVRWSYKLFRRVGCDLLHCHNVHTSPLIAAALAGVPVRIWSKLAMSPYYEQGTRPTGLHRLSLSVRTSCALAHRILAISPAVRDELTALGVGGPRVLVWPAPVDIRLLPASAGVGVRQELGLSDADLVVTTVGHAVPVKGWDILVSAFAKIHATLPQARLLLVGSTTAPGEVTFAEGVFRLVERSGLGTKVRFLGQRPDIQRILQASDAFVFPSRSDGQGLALTEALAAGLPCVASRAGGIADLIRNGDNGLLFEREDADGLASRLEGLLRDGGLRQRLARRGRESVSTLSLEHVTRRTIDLYETLLANGGRA